MRVAAALLILSILTPVTASGARTVESTRSTGSSSAFHCPKDDELSRGQGWCLPKPAAEAEEADRASAGDGIYGGLPAHRRLRSPADHGRLPQSAPTIARQSGGPNLRGNSACHVRQICFSR